MPPLFKRICVVSISILMLSSVGCKSSSGESAAAPDPGGGGSVNSAPTISGDPNDAITVGDEFTFTPDARDADGDELSFTVANQPTWASFDSSSGRLSGTPAAGAEGLYSDIRITVSDGQANASLDFDVTVNAQGAATGVVTLSWSSPTQNEDGSALTNLAGYKLYYGQSSGSYTNEIRIDNPSVTTHMIENLTATTWYVVATSFNADGVESQYTSELEVVPN